MWSRFTSQLKSSANRWLLYLLGSLAGLMGVSAYVLVRAPFALEYGILLTLALFGLWIVFALVAYTKRGAASPPSTRGASVPPQQIATGHDSRPALDAALHWLKSKTQLPAKQAARDRPWFLVIGAPQSGKTTLISGTGLDIQYPAWGNKPEEARATRGCGVYVTERAVVLDTPGEFVDPHVGGSDRFTRLLKQVARLRRREPLNGILVVVDAPQLLRLPKADLETLALAYRDQLQTITRAIGRYVPVHLLVSKCDEMADFDTFFADLAVHHPLTPAWGFALNDAERESKDWLAHCDRGLFGLYQRLVGRRTAQLRLAEDAVRDSMLAFPERFQELRERLKIFLAPLFGRTGKSGYSLVHGVFFLGALGGDAPATSTAVIPRRFAESARTLLRDVVFANPSKGNATGFGNVWAALDAPTVLLAAAALVLSMLMALGVYPAYRDNVRVVNALQKLELIPPTALPERIGALSELRQSLVYLGADEHFPAQRTRNWTLFASESLMNSALQSYEVGVRATFIDRPESCAAALENALTDASDADQLYARLKTFLMISAPGKPRGDATKDPERDRDFLLASNSPLRGCWTRTGSSDQTASQEHLDFYVHRLVQHGRASLWHEPDATAKERIGTARALLSNQNPIQAYYSEIQQLESEEAPTLDIRTAVRAQDLLVASPDLLVPGVFTRQGWDRVVQTAINQLTAEYGRERAWVLGLPADAETVKSELRKKYFQDYQSRWTGVVQTLRLSDFGVWTLATGKMVSLSGSRPDSDPTDSVYYSLLALIAENTWGRNADLSAGPVELAAVAKGFESLHRLIAAAEGKPTEIQGYLGALHAVYLKMAAYPVNASCDEKLAALPDLGLSVRRVGEVIAQLRPGIDLWFVNLEAVLRQPMNYVGTLRTRDLNACQNPVAPPPGAPGSPTVVTFLADPPTIMRGQRSTLQWVAEHVMSITIEPGIGSVPASGFRDVTPTETTTYTITAVGENGAQTSSTTLVMVESAAVPPSTTTAPLTVLVSGVLSEGAGPVAEINIFLRRVDTGTGFPIMTGKDGSFRFPEAIDPSLMYQVCVMNYESCSPPGVLQDRQPYRVQVNRGFFQGRLFRGDRRFEVRLTLTPR